MRAAFGTTSLMSSSHLPLMPGWSRKPPGYVSPGVRSDIVSQTKQKTKVLNRSKPGPRCLVHRTSLACFTTSR